MTLVEDLDELRDLLHAVTAEMDHAWPSSDEQVKSLLLRTRAGLRIADRFAKLVNQASASCLVYSDYEEFDSLRELLNIPLYTSPEAMSARMGLDPVPGLGPEHHDHEDPNAGDQVGASHDHDGLPPHFHRSGLVVNSSPPMQFGGGMLGAPVGPQNWGDPSGQTPTESGTVPTAMDTEETAPWTPEEPGPPEPPSPEYTKVVEYLDGFDRAGAEAPPDVRDAFNALMGRLNTAEDELALERLRADSAVGTARALRDRAERVEAAVKAAIAELRGGDSMETTETPPEPTPTDPTPSEPTPTEAPQPGEQTAPPEDGPGQNDPS